MNSMPESTRHERGRVANRYLRDRLQRHESGAREETIEERLLGAYLDHHVKKRLFQYLITGSNGEEAMGQLVHVVVQLAFSVLLSQERDELEDALHIRTSFCTLPVYARSTEQPVLGGLDLGSSSALGVACADAGSVACVDIDLSAKQIERLYHYPWAVRHIVRTIDTVTPIALDFKVCIGLRPEEGRFRLVRGADEHTPMLGMTTTLAG
jgi:hypothetical protein